MRDKYGITKNNRYAEILKIYGGIIMSMLKWAEQECRIACKKENPEFNFDESGFDYGYSCYKSALKAYESLCGDGHSGASFHFTKQILIRLLNKLPLTPIQDNDFFINGNEPFMPEEALHKKGLKSSLQCPRMSSLFRDETLEGKVSYHDNDRAYWIDVESPSNTFTTSNKIVDEIFPITMPYFPSDEKYKIYTQIFLVDKKNGDFDTRGIFYIETPDGETINIEKYQTTDANGEWIDISKEKYDELRSKRIDKLSEKIASMLIWTLVSNSGTEDEIRMKEVAYKKMSNESKKRYLMGLVTLCKFFEDPSNYHYNTFDIHQALCCGNESIYNSVPELTMIAKYLSDIKESMRELFTQQ